MFNKAQWIWQKNDFADTGYFTLFRKSFQLDGKKACNGKLLITADSKYRLYVNGNYIGTGPARGEEGQPYVDCWNVKKLLRSGSNCVAVQVEYYGKGSIVFSPCRAGLVMEMQNAFATGENSWKCMYPADCYMLNVGFRDMQHINWNNIPENWQSPDFDDSAWEEPVILQDNKLLEPRKLPERPVPHLSSKELHVKKIISLGTTEAENITAAEKLAASLRDMPRKKMENSPIVRLSSFPEKGIEFHTDQAAFVELDLGCDTLGTPFFELETDCEMPLDIGYSEALIDDSKVDPFRQFVHFAEQFVTRCGRHRYTVFQPRGFRYIVMRFNAPGKIRLLRAGAVEEIYVPSRKGEFKSSDETLNRIFKMCQRTMNLCMEDAYTDCPWRERQQWLGDLGVEALTSLYMLGSADLLKKAVLEFSRIESGDGWLYAVAPGGTGLNLPTFGMAFPWVVNTYYMYTADRDTVKECYRSVNQMASFLERVRKNDLICDKTVFEDKIWYFVDWTKSDAYDSDGAIQALYLKFLRDAADVAAILDDHAMSAKYSAQADATAKAMVKNFWNSSRKSFQKYRLDGSTVPAKTQGDVIAQHENFMFTALKTGSSAQRRAAIASVRGAAGKYLPDLGGMQSRFLDDQRGAMADKSIILLGSPFFSFWALAALYQQGMTKEALEYIRICWGYMLDNGADCCWEMWGATTSLCHGFSTAPGYFLFSGLLGIKPMSPGYKKVRIAPPEYSLDKVSAVMPLMQGNLKFGWKKSKSGIRITLEIPNNCNVELQLPGNKKIQRFTAGKYSFSTK